MLKISVLTSLYNCINHLENFVVHLVNFSSKYNDIEFLVLHNEPSSEELKIFERYRSQLGENVRHITIPQRESLYASWNRGIKLSQGDYVTIWNVDDLIIPEAILKVVKFMDSKPDVMLVYGNQVNIIKLGCNLKKKLVQPPRVKDNLCSKFLAMRSYYPGTFMVWRKALHDVIGFFDEQFFSGGDFDFWIRVVRSFPVMKSEEV